MAISWQTARPLSHGFTAPLPCPMCGDVTAAEPLLPRLPAWDETVMQVRSLRRGWGLGRAPWHAGGGWARGSGTGHDVIGASCSKTGCPRHEVHAPKRKIYSSQDLVLSPSRGEGKGTGVTPRTLGEKPHPRERTLSHIFFFRLMDAVKRKEEFFFF